MTKEERKADYGHTWATVIDLPSWTVPLNFSMAIRASSAVSILTKPKPRDSPVWVSESHDEWRQPSSRRIYMAGEEGQAERAHTGVGVVHDLGLVHLGVLVEQFGQLLLGHVARQARDVQVVALVLLLGVAAGQREHYAAGARPSPPCTAPISEVEKGKKTYGGPLCALLPPPPPFLAGDLVRSRRAGERSRSSRVSLRGERSRGSSSLPLPVQTGRRQSSCQKSWSSADILVQGENIAEWKSGKVGTRMAGAVSRSHCSAETREYTRTQNAESATSRVVKIDRAMRARAQWQRKR